MLKKHKLLLFVLITTLFTNTISAQVKKIPANTSDANKLNDEQLFSKLSIKAGANISVIYLARNTKDKNNEPGYSAGLTYELNDFVRFAGLFTHFRPINIEPTWYNIQATTYEANMEIMAKFPNKKTLLYPFFGFSYNTYSGFFTGESDYLNLKEFYSANTYVKNKWLGLNLGTGLEHNFGNLGLFIDYRMRIGKQEAAFNIMDVCYTMGLKMTLPKEKIKKIFNRKIKNPNDRFHWF